jgi:hypothetical protein
MKLILKKIKLKILEILFKYIKKAKAIRENERYKLGLFEDFVRKNYKFPERSIQNHTRKINRYLDNWESFDIKVINYIINKFK